MTRARRIKYSIAGALILTACLIIGETGASFKIGAAMLITGALFIRSAERG